ncbi:MAG: hypothetical protein AAF492_07185, partial [Verrucomicrobiota bacterium]
RDFMSEHGFDYPVVLKPDVGQRGAGVAIAESETDAEAYLADAAWDCIAQEYVSGDEFGIFYVRYPGQETGTIFSITDKQLPALVGDGRRTLEQLILADDRAVCMARFYLNLHRDRVYDVVPEGERIQLVRIGTHCRGAVFLDGNHLRTPELEAVIDRVSRTYDGFYFGRYDLRAASPEALSRGESFKIVELNGVTSEATHIYDPKHSLLNAWRTLMEQWRIAFEIGALNAGNGTEIIPFGRLMRLVLDFDAPHIPASNVSSTTSEQDDDRDYDSGG